MKIVSRVAVTFAAYAILPAAAACASSPAAGPTSVPQTLKASHSAAMETSRHNFTPTQTRTLESTDRLEFSPTATGVEASIVLPGWVPEGARARLGRGIINQIALSPDGKTVAVAGATGLSLFTTDSFQEVWSVPTGKGLIEVAFMNHGKEIVTLTDCCPMYSDCTHGCENPRFCLTSRWILIWDTLTGAMKKTISVDEPFEHMVALPDASSVVLWYSWEFMSSYTEMREVEVSTGSIRSSITEKDLGRLSAMIASSDGKRLIGDVSGSIVIWDVQSGHRIRVLDGPETYSQQLLAFSQSSSLLAASSGRSIRIWDLARGIQLSEWETDYGVDAIALSPDGNALATGGVEWNGPRHIDVWEVNSGRRVASRADLTDTVVDLEFLPDGHDVIAGFISLIMRLDSTTGNVLVYLSDLFSNWVKAVFFGGENEIVILPVSGRTLHIYDADAPQWKEAVQYPEGAVFSSNYHWFALPISGTEIAVFETKTGRRKYTIPRPLEFPEESRFYLSSDGRSIAIGFRVEVDSTGIDDDYNYRIELWDLQTGTKMYTLNKIVTTQYGWELVFTPDLQRVMHAWYGGGAHWEMIYDFYDLPTGKMIYQFGTTSFFGEISLSDNGLYFYGPCEAGRCIFNIQGGDVKVELQEPGIGAEDAASIFSPDGRYFAASSQDGYIFVWNADSGALLHSFKGHTGAPEKISFSEDNRWLVSTGDGSVLVWNLPNLE